MTHKVIQLTATISSRTPIRPRTTNVSYLRIRRACFAEANPFSIRWQNPDSRGDCRWKRRQLLKVPGCRLFEWRRSLEGSGERRIC
jgi:hypothetical protein